MTMLMETGGGLMPMPGWINIRKLEFKNILFIVLKLKSSEINFVIYDFCGFL